MKKPTNSKLASINKQINSTAYRVAKTTVKIPKTPVIKVRFPKSK